MQKFQFLFFGLILVFLFGCEPKEKGFLIKAEIKGAEGKYIKVINMTAPGLKIDSIELDLAGRFEVTKVIYQPNDYVFYFNPEQSIRITPLPQEQIEIKGHISDLLKTYTIAGSPGSEQISVFLKKQQQLLVELDSVRSFYMQNQLSPDIDTIIEIAKHRSDSIFNVGKLSLISVIENNPGSMASYVALAQKLGKEMNFFTLANDFKYFEMVDTALTRAYDTAMVAQMLNGYVHRGKQLIAQQKKASNNLQIGDMAPEITLPNLMGDTLKLSALKGKYVLVDFWGSWCRPCRLEHPNLRKAYWRYRKRGFDVYQVALERNKEDWKNTIREDKLPWKNQVSELNYMASKAARIFKVKTIPTNYLLDPDRKIIAINLHGEELLDKLREIFPPKIISKATIDTTKSDE